MKQRLRAMGGEMLQFYHQMTECTGKAAGPAGICVRSLKKLSFDSTRTRLQAIPDKQVNFTDESTF